MSLSRRALLGAGLAGIMPLPTPLPLRTPSALRTPAPADADWRALADGLAGTVERPGTGGYDQARRLHSPRFDQIRPPAVVRCANQDDVVETIVFANRFGLPVVPRNGGHSHVGASTSSSGPVLDLRAVNSVEFDAASGTATIGGGATVRDVAGGLDGHGAAVPVAACDSVGISGLTCGGGIGSATAAYGLTSDCVVAADVVTADGRARTVDGQREPELFWALRGGGGGRFGVVTSWRMRTHPAGPVGTFTLRYPWADAAAVVTGWLSRVSTAPDSVWPVCRLESDRAGRLSAVVSGSVLDGDAHTEVAALTSGIGRDPASATVGLAPPASPVTAGQPPPAGQAPPADPLPSRATQLTGSEIFAGPLPPAGVAALLSVLQRRAAAKLPGLAELSRLTGAPARVTPGTTAFPWHGAHTLLQWLAEPVTADAATVADAYTWIDSGHHTMAAWSAGRYLNYLEPGPFDPARYHGRNVDRLRKIHNL